MNQDKNDPNSLDGRLRSAHQRQLTQTRLDVEGVQFRDDRAAHALRPRILAVAAALLIMGVSSLVVVRMLADSNTNIEATGAPESPDPTRDTTSTTRLDSEPETSDPGAFPTPTTSDPGRSATTDKASPGSGSDEPGVATSTTVITDDTTGSPATTSEPGLPTTTISIVTAAGVANSVCPTGQRAELERATLSYVGLSEGWGRLNDLVDEQDGPHYFEAWEPGYPDPVTVLVELDQPVLASEIRVAQDPFTPVAGTITLTALGQQFGLELEGTDGWISASFAPQPLESFTLTRSDQQSNVMEVLVCVVSNAD